MFFIKLIAIIFLVGVITALVTGVKLLWRLRSFMDGLKGPAAGASRQRGSANPARGREGVIDNRDPQKARQKIFSKDDGEYVDYTVEDDEPKRS